MTLTVEIPTLETGRLCLRAPRMDDMAAFAAFMGSGRARFVGGPVTERTALARAFGHVAGLWVLRGYGCFVAEARATGRAVGLFGLWYPQPWPEPEFSWAVWDPDAEGRGFATEAMRALIPWSFRRAGIDTAISVVDADNAASRRVAERLGARLNAADTVAANSPGTPFHSDAAAHVVVYRHRRVS